MTEQSKPFQYPHIGSKRGAVRFINLKALQMAITTRNSKGSSYSCPGISANPLRAYASGCASRAIKSGRISSSRSGCCCPT